MANREHLAILTKGVDYWNHWRAEGKTANSDFTSVEIISADLTDADLTDADLTDADLIVVDLSGANLSGANLSGANLTHANLSGANLSGADLTSANLWSTNFSGAKLINTEFNKSILGSTLFTGVDLSNAKGLGIVRHLHPSSIGVDTLFLSKGNIPEEFLRGCGVPEDFIHYIPSLVGAEQAVQFYSCFISYSTQDEEFAKRLHSRMQAEKLRVWFAPEDIKGGEKLIDQIDTAIQVYDKLLLVLSESSMRSKWVVNEIRRARKTEEKEGRRKLFPIRLVGFKTIEEWEHMVSTGEDIAEEIRSYFIPDFTNWKDHDAFEAAFDRLLRDLKAEEKTNV